MFAVEPDIALLPPPPPEFVGLVDPFPGDDDFFAGGSAWLPPEVPPPEPPPEPPIAVGGESSYSGIGGGLSEHREAGQCQQSQH